MTARSRMQYWFFSSVFDELIFNLYFLLILAVRLIRVPSFLILCRLLCVFKYVFDVTLFELYSLFLARSMICFCVIFVKLSVA